MVSKWHVKSHPHYSSLGILTLLGAANDWGGTLSCGGHLLPMELFVSWGLLGVFWWLFLGSAGLGSPKPKEDDQPWEIWSGRLMKFLGHSPSDFGFESH